MSICTESTKGPRQTVSQVLGVVGFFAGQRVSLLERYDYPYKLPGAGAWASGPCHLARPPAYRSPVSQPWLPASPGSPAAQQVGGGRVDLGLASDVVPHLAAVARIRAGVGDQFEAEHVHLLGQPVKFPGPARRLRRRQPFTAVALGELDLRCRLVGLLPAARAPVTDPGVLVHVLVPLRQHRVAPAFQQPAHFLELGCLARIGAEILATVHAAA